MADNSKIEWTDATWNPIRARNRASGKVGWFCTHASEGCRHCYAETFNARLGTGVDYKAQDLAKVKIFLDEKTLLQPVRWLKPRRIFVGSMTDLFADFVTDEMLDKIFAVMCLAPQHTFQVLTKRPERMRTYFAETWQPAPAQTYPPFAGLPAIDVPAETEGEDRWSQINAAIDEITLGEHSKLFDQNRFWDANESLIGRPAWPRRPLPNVWLGTSAEDQPNLEARVWELLRTPATVHFLSAEPLLGGLDLEGWDLDGDSFLAPLQAYTAEELTEQWGEPCDAQARLDWVIVGGESGREARPMHPDWARKIRDDCAAAGVAFFFKQWGEWAPRVAWGPHLGGGRFAPMIAIGPDGAEVSADVAPQDIGGQRFERVGKEAAGHTLDGIIHQAFPDG